MVVIGAVIAKFLGLQKSRSDGSHWAGRGGERVEVERRGESRECAGMGGVIGQLKLLRSEQSMAEVEARNGRRHAN